jgi:hypothetical protein
VMLLLDEPCVTDPARRMSRLHEGRLPVCPGDPDGEGQPPAERVGASRLARAALIAGVPERLEGWHP